jgi:hypothetical protein
VFRAESCGGGGGGGSGGGLCASSSYQLSVKLGQTRLAIVIENQDGVDHGHYPNDRYLSICEVVDVYHVHVLFHVISPSMEGHEKHVGVDPGFVSFGAS